MAMSENVNHLVRTVDNDLRQGRYRFFNRFLKRNVHIWDIS